MTLKTGLGVHQGIETDMDRSDAYDFLLTFHSNRDTVTKINGDFSRKSQIFPTLCVCCAPAEGVPSELGIDAGSKNTRMMAVSGQTKSLTVSSAVWIQSTNVTDRQTPGDSKDRAYA